MRVTSLFFVFLVLGLSACVTAKDLREGGRHSLGGDFNWDFQPLLKAKSGYELQSSVQNIFDKFDKALSQQKNAKFSLSDLLASAIEGFPLNSEEDPEPFYEQYWNGTSTIIYGNSTGDSTTNGFKEYFIDTQKTEGTSYEETVTEIRMSDSNTYYEVSRSEGRFQENEFASESIEIRYSSTFMENKNGSVTLVGNSTVFLTQLTTDIRPGETSITVSFIGEENNAIYFNSYVGKRNGTLTSDAELTTFTISGEGSENTTIHSDERQSQRESNLLTSMFQGAKPPISADILEETVYQSDFTQAINGQIKLTEGASPFSANFTETVGISMNPIDISNNFNGYAWSSSQTLQPKDLRKIQLINIMNIFK